jgi:hypothetical protein
MKNINPRDYLAKRLEGFKATFQEVLKFDVKTLDSMSTEKLIAMSLDLGKLSAEAEILQDLEILPLELKASLLLLIPLKNLLKIRAMQIELDLLKAGLSKG